MERIKFFLEKKKILDLKSDYTEPKEINPVASEK